MGHLYATIPKQKLRVLYENRGLSLRSIAKIYRCDLGVIRRALCKRGITVRRPTAPLSLDGHELRALYLDKKLSTYKIATRYSCDPKTVYRYLILNSIPTRHRKRITLGKEVLYRLYAKERKSLSTIARIHGYSAAGILKKLRGYRIERRAISETSTKHPKTDFSGDQKERGYLIGFRIGDLGVRNRRNLIYASSGTTKVAQSKLIHGLFCAYGPVWIGKRDRRNAMNVSCLLNRSFSFLLPKHTRIPKWIQNSGPVFFSFLAGYTDAEGNIDMMDERARFRLRSCDKGILRDIHVGLKRRGIKSLFGLDRRAGTDARGIKLNKDCWFVIINEKWALSRLFMILLPLLRHQKRKNDAKTAMANVTRRLSQ